MFKFFNTTLPHLDAALTKQNRIIIIIAAIACLPVASQTLAWPLSVLFIALFIIGWRFPAQPFWLKLLTILFSFGLLYVFRPADQQGFFSAAIVGLTALKSLELRNLRDGQFLLLTALFALFSGALILPSVWMSGIVLSGTAGLLLGHYLLLNPDIHFSWTRFKKLLWGAAKVSIFALPIIALLFYAFPRVGGQFFQLGLVAKNETGLSDRLTPGALSELAMGNTTHFRVLEDNEFPQLYYRVYVLDEYDGITWQTSEQADIEVYQNKNTTLSVTIEMEPKGQTWLPLPEWAKFDGNSPLGPYITLSPSKPLEKLWVENYQVNPKGTINVPALTDEKRQHLTFLPDNNPETRAWAKQFKNMTFLEVVRSLQQIISTEHIYTLQPPMTKTTHHVDELLFLTKQGYCGHYANALAYIFRLLDYPTRVVIGFQGGEYNQVGEYWEVGDADAHAWVEVYNEQQWIRIDPTAWLAPSRLNMSASLLRNQMQIGLDNQFEYVLPEGFSRNIDSFWKNIRDGMDSIQRQYVLWVVDFNRERQNKLWATLSQLSQWLFASVIIGGLSLISIRYTRVDRTMHILDRWLRKQGYSRGVHETPAQVAQRFPQLSEFAACWSDLHYGSKKTNQRELMKKLKKATTS